MAIKTFWSCCSVTLISILLWILFGLLSVSLSVQSLDLEGVREGPCSGINYLVQRNGNSSMFMSNDLMYISGGSRYHLYRFAALHPNFSNLREYELYYEGCFQSRQNKTANTGSVLGFGNRVLGKFHRKVYSDKPGVVDFIPEGEASKDNSRHYVTLTDNQTFILFANCWMGVNERSWDLVTKKPEVTKKLRTIVEDHLIRLGFDRSQFVFLKYDSCPK